MRYEDLPSALAPPESGEARPSTVLATSVAVTPRSRRDFMRVIGAAGVGIGLAAVGWLPPARRARASHAGTDGYQIADSCWYGGYSDSCSDPCHSSPICGHCCQTDSSAHKYGWHRDTGSKYRLRKDQCTDSDSGSTDWDGWKWQFSGCCAGCTNPWFRCHDGRYCSDGTLSTCGPTICKWITTCACTSSCPC